MLTGRKLLLADDSLTIQKVVSLTFGDEGCIVTCVGDGASALGKIEEIEPDVVLADVFMPGLSGYELCERIKQHERFGKVPVLLLVGTFEPYNEEEARRVGADDVLTKPFQSIRELVGKVGDLLSGKSERTPAEVAQPETAEAYADPIMDDEMIEATSVSEPAVMSHQALMQEAAIPEATMHAESFAPDTSFEMATNGAATSSEYKHTASHLEPVVEAHDEQNFGYGTSEISQHETQAHDTEAHTMLADEVSASQSPASETFAHTIETLAGKPIAARAELWDENVLELGEESRTPQTNDDFVLELDDEPVEPVVTTHEVEPSHSFGHTAAVVGAGIVAGAGAVAALIMSHHGETVTDSHAEQDAPVASTADANVQATMTATPEVKVSETARAQMNVAGQMNATDVSASNISPELIEAVARRVVELMSNKVVEEIAWEVVPQLSELMIKRKLEGGKL